MALSWPHSSLMWGEKSRVEAEIQADLGGDAGVVGFNVYLAQTGPAEEEALPKGLSLLW